MATLYKGQLNGAFEGWDGSKVYQTLDGRRWQQASYTYRYKYSYMPRVQVYNEGGRTLMHVDGDQPQEVRPA